MFCWLCMHIKGRLHTSRSCGKHLRCIINKWKQYCWQWYFDYQQYWSEYSHLQLYNIRPWTTGKGRLTGGVWLTERGEHLTGIGEMTYIHSVYKCIIKPTFWSAIVMLMHCSLQVLHMYIVVGCVMYVFNTNVVVICLNNGSNNCRIG